MKRQEFKKLIARLPESDVEAQELSRKIEEAGVCYDFSEGFHGRVMDRLFTAGVVVNRELEFLRSWNNAFFRIALTGVAAIVILVISIYLIDGSFSINSILGLNDSYDESIVCLLTGN